MTIKVERAVWTAIPCGSPSQPRRLSVVISPRIEGQGRVKLKDLSRFLNWPDSLAAETLAVRLDGAIVPCKTVTSPDLAPQNSLWTRLFPEELDIDLVDLAQVFSATNANRTPVVSPAIETTRVFKGVYRARIVEQVLSDSYRRTPGPKFDQVLSDSYRRNISGPLSVPLHSEAKVDSWRSYVGQLSDMRQTFSTFAYLEAAPATAATQLMQFHEAFHARPPMKIFPDVLRDERDLKDLTAAPIAADKVNASQTLSAQQFQILPAFKEVSPNAVVRIENSSGGGTQALPTAMVVAKPGDRVVGGNIGFKLRPGDTIELAVDTIQWICKAVVVQIQAGDDGAILYGRHLYAIAGQPHSLVFRLPPTPPPGFTVTVRNLEPQQLFVTGPNISEQVYADEGKTFRWEGAQWQLDSENREDLHRRIAMFRSYPALMRRLGLVIDLELIKETPNTSGLIRVVPTGKAAADDLCPWTHYDRKDGLFLPADRDNERGFRRGFLSKEGAPGRFSIVQIDSDGAAMKNLQQARSREIHENLQKNSVSLAQRGHPDDGGDLATLRQIGIALCDSQSHRDTDHSVSRAGDVARALCADPLSACPELAGSAEEPQKATIPLFAEDLTLGFRVDVKRRRAGDKTGARQILWKSLCARSGRYFFPGTSMDGEADWIWPDEGFVAQVADEVSDPKATDSALRQSQSLFKWDGWSLAAEKPGAAFSESTTGLSKKTPGTADTSILRTRFKATTRSLARLRLGDRYSFRVRTVDLAGNSLPPQDADALTSSLSDPRVFNSGCYERTEPLAPPLLVPLQKPRAGEANDQLVIRSRHNAATEESGWFVLPPGASPSFVELHGTLDGLTGKESWYLLKDHNGTTPEWSPDKRGHDDEWIKRGWNHSTGRFIVPYLPDPLTNRALVRQRDERGMARTVAAIDLEDAGTYPARISGRLLRLQSSSVPHIAVAGAALRVGLPEGRMARVEIASNPVTSEFTKFGLLNWCQCTPTDPCDEVEPSGSIPPVTEAELKAAACAGQLGLITPSRELTLIHAVEKPLVPSGRKTLGFVTDQTFRFGNPAKVALGVCETSDGNVGACSFELSGSVWIDRPSTGNLDIRLDWTEPIDDPSAPDYILQKHALHPFQVPVPLFSEDFVQFPETASACAAVTPTATAACNLSDSFPIVGSVKFDDGRHRKVSLSFEATSRFVDCYEESEQREALGQGTPDGKQQRFRRGADSVTVHFPARLEPKAPSTVYIVPTFRFSRDKSGVGTRVQRHCGLRVFLERNWCSSGEDEKLAVVFAPERTTQLDQPLSDVVSAWAADPLWEPLADDTPPYDRLGQRMPFMPERPLLADIQNAEIAIPSLITPLRVFPAGDAAKQPVELKEVELALAAFTPQIDQQKNLRYVDIDITAPTYFSFLRFGLARYQPYAEEGRALSVIVPAVFCQLLPDISVTVVPAKHHCYEVTVLAPASYSSPSLVAPNPTRIDRQYDVIVLRAHATSSDLPSAFVDGVPHTRLQHVSDGDGQGKWRGLVAADDAGCRPQFLIVERQSWATGGARIVGCVATY